MKRKNGVPTHLKLLIMTLQSEGKKIKYIQCNNAGEHEPLKKYCEENGITLEMTAPNTPQHKGVVKRRFELYKGNVISSKFHSGNGDRIMGNGIIIPTTDEKYVNYNGK